MHFSPWSAWNSPAETEGLQKKKKKEVKLATSQVVSG